MHCPDDGSTVKVDGQDLVDNDGKHSPQSRSAQMALRKGLHSLSIRYFDYWGGTLHVSVLDSEGKELQQEELWSYSE